MDEHRRTNAPVQNHGCPRFTPDPIILVRTTDKWSVRIAEAVKIKQMRPDLNQKDEFMHNLLITNAATQ